MHSNEFIEVQQWAANTVDLWEQRLDTLNEVLENSIDISKSRQE
jgi:hypothetical protein